MLKNIKDGVKMCFVYSDYLLSYPDISGIIDMNIDSLRASLLVIVIRPYQVDMLRPIPVFITRFPKSLGAIIDQTSTHRLPAGAANFHILSHVLEPFDGNSLEEKTFDLKYF